MLEDGSGGGMSTEELPLSAQVHCRIPSKETALAWTCRSWVISLQNWEKPKWIKLKKKSGQSCSQRDTRELLEAGHVQVSV